VQRRRRGLQDDDTCNICSQQPETIDHLLIGCSFSRSVWYQVLHHFGWHHIAPSEPSSFAEWWTLVRKRVVKEHRQAFDSIAVLVVWSIWLHHNDRVFGRQVLSDAHLVALVLAQAAEWCRAGLVVRSVLFGD
jgi:hypothetical protein